MSFKLAAITSGRVVCAGKHIIPYDEVEVQIENKTFSPLLCENCDEHMQSITLVNNGEHLVFNISYGDTNKIPTLSNGPLRGKGKYRFQGIHFNWIYKTPDDWSWNDVKFPAELHITFYNMKYGNFEAAVNANEGLAILSIIFHVGKEDFQFLKSL